MAGTLGQAELELSVDNVALSAGLRRAEALAAQAGRKIASAVTPKTGAQNTLFGLQFKRGLLENAISQAQIGSKEYRKLQREILKVDRALDKASKPRGSGVLSLAGGLTSAFAALGVGAFLKGAINEAVQLETITRKLSNTLGKDGAGAALQFTRGLADRLGLSFKTLAGNFASFTAAASGAGVPLEQQKALFAAVAKAGQALGLSNDEISGSLLALQQVASKGVVQMEELRGQLGERLPIAFAAAARGMGLTQQELIKLVESGQLSSNRFFPALTKGLNEMTEAAGGVATAAQNFQKLENAWNDLQVSFGTNLLPRVTEETTKLTKALNGAGVALDAGDLGYGSLLSFIGIIPEGGVKAAASLRTIGQTANLSKEEMKGLWDEVLREKNIKVPQLLKPEELDQVLDRITDIALERRRSVVDINKEAAESKRLLDISAARTEAEKKLLKPAQQRLENAQRLAGLEGQARQIAQAQLEIELARQKAAEATAAAFKARGQEGNEAGAAKLQVAADAASADLQTAMIQGGEAMKSAAQAAADQLKSASEALKGTLRTNLDYLDRYTRQQVVREARVSLNRSLATGRFDRGKVLSEVKTNRDLLDMATKLEGINKSFDNYDKAKDNLAKVEEQLPQSLESLGVKVTDLTDRILKLAEKNWNVYVDAGYWKSVDRSNEVYARNLGY